MLFVKPPRRTWKKMTPSSGGGHRRYNFMGDRPPSAKKGGHTMAKGMNAKKEVKKPKKDPKKGAKEAKKLISIAAPPPPPSE
jgi:hypothetical protein